MAPNRGNIDISASADIGPGGVILHQCRVDEDCRIGPGVILDSGSDGRIDIEADVCIQAGAIIHGSVTIGRGALVRAGAVVNRDVPPHAVVAGSPAQIVGYTTNAPHNAAPATGDQRPATPGRIATGVHGVTLHRLPKVLDLRGNLTVGEFGQSVPFETKRYFMVFGVPNAEVRGEHAHRTCHQFLVCAHGRLAVVADDGTSREEFVLDDPSVGLHLPPLTWGVQYKNSRDAVLLVFASEHYDANEYIRDYAEFMQLTSENPHERR